MKFYLSLMVMSGVLVFTACQKPAYSDLKVDEKGRVVNQGNEAVSAQPAAGAANSAASDAQTPNREPAAQSTAPPPASSTPDAAQNPAPVQIPAFFDTTKGEIKDLPRYPESVPRNMQVGPLNGVPSALILLDARGPMEKIAKFYDAAVKSKGWTVVVRIDDPEIYKLELKKGDLNEALVQVNKDKQSGQITIILSRAEQPPPAKP